MTNEYIKYKKYLYLTFILISIMLSQNIQAQNCPDIPAIVQMKKISPTSGDLTATIETSDFFGYSVSGIGDLDGNGVNDIIVGAERDDDGGQDRGAVYILFLDAFGNVIQEQKISDTEGNLSRTFQNDERFGRAVASIGDLDNDGVPDVAVGASFNDTGGESTGAVVILLLNTDGTVKSWSEIGDAQIPELEAFDHFGEALTPIGDKNGDGIEDLAIGSPFEDDGDNGAGAMYITYLNTNGTYNSHTKISNGNSGMPAVSIPMDARFGSDMDFVGDIDSDGIDDMVVGAYNHTGGGAAYVLIMNADNSVREFVKLSEGQNGIPPGTLIAGDQFGAAISIKQGYPGDPGQVGALIGAPRGDDGGEGDVGVFYSVLFDNQGLVTSLTRVTQGEQGFIDDLEINDQFANAIAPLGDLGNGVSIDYAVGMRADDDGVIDGGAVYILFTCMDSDLDGVTDDQDIDDDNDGIPDAIEDANASNNGDTDGDGFRDAIDLDSDNDAILDIEENGYVAFDLDQDFDGRTDVALSVGSNGLADTLETSADSGILNYTVVDTDTDGTPDYIDLDSDNDSVNDVREGRGIDSGGDGTADGANMAALNSGIPSTVLPSRDLKDSDCDDIPDYLEIDGNDDGVFDISQIGIPGLEDANDDGMVDGPDGIDNDGIMPSADDDDTIWGDGNDPVPQNNDAIEGGVAVIDDAFIAERLLLGISFDARNGNREEPCKSGCPGSIDFLDYYGPGGIRDINITEQITVTEMRLVSRWTSHVADYPGNISSWITTSRLETQTLELNSSTLTDPSICSAINGATQSGINSARCYDGFSTTGNPYDPNLGADQNGISLFIEYPATGTGIVTEGFYFETSELGSLVQTVGSQAQFQLYVFEWLEGNPTDPANVNLLHTSNVITANPDFDWQKIYIPFPQSLNTVDWEGKKIIYTVIPWTNGASDMFRFDDLAILGFCSDYMNIGDKVWRDDDRDGLFDIGEPGIENVQIKLYADNGNGEFNPNGEDLESGTILTDSNGEWNIDFLRPGNYFVHVTPVNFEPGAPLNGLEPTPGTSVLGNSDIDGQDHAFLIDAFISTGVSSSFVTLANMSEPTNDGNDAQGNQTVDFGFAPLDAAGNLSIGNLVWDDDNGNGIFEGAETGIPNVVLHLYRGDYLGGSTFITSTLTDTNGEYAFSNIGEGDYTVVVASQNFEIGAPLEGFTSSLEPILAPDPDNDIDNDDNGANTSLFPAAVAAESVTLTFGGEPIDDGDIDDNTNFSVDFGFTDSPNTSLGNIGNLVWNDVNFDGMNDGTEAGIDGVELVLWLDNGDGFINPVTDISVQETTTAGGGLYNFSNLINGIYIIEIKANNFQSGGPLEGLSSSLGGANANSDVDNDDNGGDNPLPHILGIYSSGITIITALEPDIAVDGDGINGNLTIDFGFHAPPPIMAIGNLVWEDYNNNSIVDAGEPGIPNVTISLFEDINLNDKFDPGIDTQIGASTTTDASGNYLFEDLAQGFYFVRIDPVNWQVGGPLEVLISSELVSCPDFDIDNDDSGFDHLSIDSMSVVGLASGIISLVFNTEPNVNIDGGDKNDNLTIDWGFYEPLFIGDLIWDDEINGNGIFDGSETGISKVVVNLVLDDGDGIYELDDDLSVAIGASSPTGQYIFPFLMEGDYFVVLPSTNFTNSGSELYGYQSNSFVVPEVPTADNQNHGIFLSDSTVVSGLVQLRIGMEPDVADDGNGPSGNTTIDFGLNPPPARLRPRIFLGGAYNTNDGLIRDDLRLEGIIPTSDPYVDFDEFTHVDGGGDQIADPTAVFGVTGPEAIVDWGFVELRSTLDSTIVLQTSSGLIQRDGDVVGLDGKSPIEFSNFPTGDYYVAVRHRNHLGAMTLNPVATAFPSTVVDFTDPGASNGVNAWGTMAQQQQTDGKFALWGGNVDSDDRVDFDGGSNGLNDKDGISSEIINTPENTTFSTNFILPGYLRSDINLDGVTKFEGGLNDKDALGVLVITHPSNTTFASNYIILEQLPR